MATVSVLKNSVKTQKNPEDMVTKVILKGGVFGVGEMGSRDSSWLRKGQTDAFQSVHNILGRCRHI